MTVPQIILTVLTIAATLYELLKVVTVGALVSRYGYVRISPGLYLMILLCIAIQALFVLSMTDSIPDISVFGQGA